MKNVMAPAGLRGYVAGPVGLDAACREKGRIPLLNLRCLGRFYFASIFM
jgi:hypothetical protein